MFFKIFRIQSRIRNNPLFSQIFIRTSHTDIKVPDYSEDMRPSVSHPQSIASQSDANRKMFTYVISGILFTSGLYSIKSEVIRDVKSMDVTAEVLAMAKVEINLNEIPEDKNVTFKWRGKPLFIWHRTDDAVKAVREIPLNILRDPQRDEDRVKDPKFLVCLGICTHLGCVPISHQGDFGGYYCPCHGSHFDISGRARKGPAPTNLEIPEYTISGNTLIVG